jgi:hypothetical protein
MMAVLEMQERLMVNVASTAYALHPADNQTVLWTEIAEIDLHRHLTRSHMKNPRVKREY